MISYILFSYFKRVVTESTIIYVFSIPCKYLPKEDAVRVEMCSGAHESPSPPHTHARRTRRRCIYAHHKQPAQVESTTSLRPSRLDATIPSICAVETSTVCGRNVATQLLAIGRLPKTKPPVGRKTTSTLGAFLRQITSQIVSARY